MQEPRTRIRLCGRPVVEIDGRAVTVPAGQAESLLCFLLAHRDGPVDRQRLIDVVWPGRPPRDPQAALRPILSRLRRALAPGEIDGRDRVRLVLPEPVWVDVEEAARAGPREALELIGPGFLPHLDDDWVRARREQVQELALAALERVGDEPAARELIARAPFRESGYRLLMEALAAGGNVAEALRVYEELRCRLRDELGVTPAPEIVALHRRLLAGDVPLPAILAPRGREPFVGRAAELEALTAAWGAGHRGLVLLSGPAGIGKTRLAGEFGRALHGQGTVLYGSCPPEPLLSYQPFVEALSHYIRNAAPTVRSGPGTAELAQLIPELGVAPGPGPGDPETRRYLMFEAVSALLSDAAPVLLVLDDLHWADRPTLQLLRHVLRAQDDARLLIVGTTREGEASDVLAALLADLRRDRLVDALPLRGLDERDVAALIEGQTGGAVSSPLVRTVHAETDGNPFFVEEVVRHLLESGRWSDTLTPGQIGVPEGVKDVLTRRLARLSEPCRTTLLDAAVLGREFDFHTLRLMAETDEDAVIAALEEALDARLIVEAGDGYAFTHALVRETLYGTLSAPRRQRLHAAAAGAVEQAAPSSLAALARHHRLAGPAGDAARAIDYSLGAGARASELFAWEEAAGHWEGALAVMDRCGADAATRAGVLVALAELMAVIGDLGREISCLERALALYGELRDDERAAQLHSRLGQAHSLIDSTAGDHMDIRRAFQHFDAARPVLERGPVRKSRGHLETGVATALTYGLQVPRGIEAATRAIAIAEHLGDEALWAGATQAFAWHKIVAGDLAEGFDAAERAFATADAGQRPFLAWMASSIKGHMTLGIGDPDAGQALFERALRLPYARDVAFQHETTDSIGRCHAARGEIEQARGLRSDARAAISLAPILALWDGSWEAVEAFAERVLATSRRNGNRWDEWAALHMGGRAAYLRRDHGRAGDRLERALAVAADGGADTFAMQVLPDLARVHADTGRVEAARACVERCRAILERGEDWRGRCGVAMIAEAVVLGAEDRPGEADARFAAAQDILRRYRLAVDEADCLHEWARALARAGDAEGAAGRREAALALYRGHGAGAAWSARVGGEGAIIAPS